MATVFSGGITVTPAVPAHILTWSRFRSRVKASLAGTDVFIETDTAADSSEIVMVDPGGRGSLDGVVADLKAIIDQIGDGFTFDGYLSGHDLDGAELDGRFRVSIRDGNVIQLRDGQVVYGLGPIGSALSGDDIAAALVTLAEMWGNDSADLSSRQAEVAELVKRLWVRDNPDDEDEDDEFTPAS